MGDFRKNISHGLISKEKLGPFKRGYENSSAIVRLIELDNILLVPPEKWESLLHRPRQFELGIDISRTVSRGRLVHRGRLIYRLR